MMPLYAFHNGADNLAIEAHVRKTLVAGYKDRSKLRVQSKRRPVSLVNTAHNVVLVLHRVTDTEQQSQNPDHKR